ncbi:MAG: tetratricopeptide repeat protein, partial [Planctomycetes bacterium]|nr:tetratricopeptide repeat protein [Planctomycetota bacterium]
AQAIELIQQAIQIRNDVPAMHSNIAEAYRAMGRNGDAIAHARTALKLQPNYHACRANLALALAADRQLDEAEKELRRVIEAEPRNALAWNNLGNVLREAKKQDSALAATHKAVQIEPNNPEFLSNLGQLLVEDGDYEEARDRLENAVKLAPRMAAARNNLGNLYRELGMLPEAANQYDEALKLQPNLAITHNNQGQLHQQKGEYDAAFKWYQQSLQLNPRDTKTICNFASGLVEVERRDDAEKLYRAALQIDPQHVPALCGLGGLARRDAKLEEARDYFQRAIYADPKSAGGHSGLAGIYSEEGKFEETERELREVIRLERAPGGAYEVLANTLRKKLPEADVKHMRELLGEVSPARPRARVGLLFGLGTWCDQTGHYEEAAQRLDEANAIEGESLRQRGLSYKPEEHARWIDDMIRVFDQAYFERVKGWGLDTEIPVFVLGLPRSGTTLAEQVLASHPKVHGADELRLARESLLSVPGVLGLNESVPDCIPRLTRDAVQQISTAHLDKLRAHDPAAERIVDKMPENYVNIGMIVTMFPNARIIHMQRDFRDVATSCWNVHFGQIRWANDKQHIASHFANYKRVMQHWHEVLPGRILDMPYAGMVDDLETQARRMLDFCGLEWDPACLEFHKTERTVRTASLAQVRQPIYKKAVERWRNYEPWWGDWYRQLDQIQNVQD